MKIINRVLIIILGIGIVLSCSKDEGGSSNNVDSNFKVFKNQTGYFNVDALQAQHKNSQGVLNFYGDFDQDSNPTSIKTVTYQKTNNDTIVNLIIDPLTSKLASSYITVKGVKSDIVVKFDYPNDTHLSVSIHQFDWVNNTSEMINGANLEIPISTTNKSSNTKNGISLSSSGDGIWAIGSLLTGLVVAETVGIIGGGFTLGLISGISSVAAAAIAAPLFAVTAAIVAASLIIDSANASELTPSDLTYPDDTPIENPVTTEEDPTPNLTPFDCSGTLISFKPVMYQDGTIVIEDISGGVGPYLYLVETEIRDFQIFPNNYDDGGYEVCLRDANGCITCIYTTLERPNDCGNTNLSVTTTTTNNSVTANATGGQPPYNYTWSNGNTGASVTNLTGGTYSVNVTDELGCTSFAIAVIGDVTDIDGNVYPSVKIGGQYWLQKNLNVSKYRNGDPIPEVTDPTAWAGLTTGAWCYFENNTANGLVYGKLYNWYAVNDPRGLAPEGWHVPSSSEYDALTNFLGGRAVAGEKMKSTTSWKTPNTDATNSSGFTGLMGGYRINSGGFKDRLMSIDTYRNFWWSSTYGFPNQAPNATSIQLYSHGGGIGFQNSGCTLGYSVRCVMD